MNTKVRLYSDGQVVEFRDDLPIRHIATEGNVNRLIQALRFSRSKNFEITDGDPPAIDDMPQARGGRHINDQGLNLLKTFEGLRLESYDDGVGVWTIGYGHTADVVPGMSMTAIEAEEILHQDLAEFESYVEDKEIVQVDLNADQYSALVCFVFNVGPEAFRGSTLLRLLNAGDFVGAAGQFLRWNKGGNQEMLGLTRRRLAEQALFNSEAWEFALTHDGNVAPVVTAQPVVTSEPTAAAPRRLQLTEPRMTGEDVRRLQLGLQRSGLVVETDGVFGSKTEIALRQWQEKEGWTVDGIAGPSLIAALA